MNAWKLAIIITVIAMSIGYVFYDAPAKPEKCIGICSKGAPPDRMVIEETLRHD